MAAERKTLTQLFVPICVETLFYMLSGMVDTLMLSSVSDQAVGAVGTANTYIGVFIIMFGVISSGMVAVMSQNIGAGRPGVAYQARQLGLMFNAVMGILMSVILAVFSGGILRIVSIAPALFEPAETYLKIVGGACFLNALIPIFSSYLRVFGVWRMLFFAKRMELRCNVFVVCLECRSIVCKDAAANCGKRHIRTCITGTTRAADIWIIFKTNYMRRALQ